MEAIIHQCTSRPVEVEGVVAAFEEIVGADTVGGEGAVLRVALRVVVEREGIDGGRTVETTDSGLVARLQKTKAAITGTAAACWACERDMSSARLWACGPKLLGINKSLRPKLFSCWLIPAVYPKGEPGKFLLVYCSQETVGTTREVGLLRA